MMHYLAISFNRINKMTTYTTPYFEMNSYNIQSVNIDFFKELYILMNKYNIHRIYTACLDKKKLIIAQQLLDVCIGKNKISKKIYKFLEEHTKWIYFNIIFQRHIFKYKLRLKKLFKKYGIEKIKATSFDLYQGIHITDNSLCIREIDLISKSGHILHIDTFKLNI